MCGIVGYIGFRNAQELIIAGLEKLEYRGYDSAGVAILVDGKLEVTRASGKLIELKAALLKKDSQKISTIGIGHTRWATHGKPAEHNAHPHTAGRVSLVHNGIIENYIELRKELEEEGFCFTSETDTEIAAQLFNKYLGEGMERLAALQKTCSRIRGSYAFVALDSQCPDSLFVAKTATPVVIGIADGEAIIASDIPPLLEYTRNVIVLEDGDFAEVRAGSLRVFNGGSEKERPVRVCTWDPVTAQKGGYKHFMLKEIYEQAQAAADTLRGRIDKESQELMLPEIQISPESIRSLRRIIIVACGTAWHAGLVAKRYLESFLALPCDVDYASEFRYRRPFLDKDTLVLSISQSGETADTLAAMDLANGHSHLAAICNVLGSSLSRRVSNTVFTQAGPEISVASTKAFTTQIIASYILALFLAQHRGRLSKDEISLRIHELLRLPAALNEALKTNVVMTQLAKRYHKATDFIYLGRGICYPIALEGALKMKEISYIHAEGYPAGEIKHGPLALIDETVPVVVLLQKSEHLFEKTISNMREVEARGGKLVCITDVASNEALHDICDAVVEVPHISEELSPILMSIPLQLFAYYTAVFNKTDVDLPRNLAKSVTVE
ncbi:MAG: glutamine--fructose-6-phosphate transaminase (isomerizing) [SAR324 cluster bacterium]|uniref:Glutamine--fructose-6-phosphate aminotransferase [isomerizing] n=1 Tax=SAR324 cluster bacterium TaxID=2024889 RepID=A0A7X9FS26_9DELT|nr:glutamine--fructose-6-phosphate transaminase (isomerizing) [SAR324 cluster bacterium]